MFVYSKQLQNDSVAIIGATTWGTTLGIILARRGFQVNLLVRSEAEEHLLETRREHTLRLPGYEFPESMRITSSGEKAFDNAQAAIYAVPASRVRENVRNTLPYISGTPLLIIASKGLERDSGKRMSEIFFDELPVAHHRSICVLSGPNLAREIIKGHPAMSVISASDLLIAQSAQAILNSSAFRVYTNEDLIGVELGGALKNIIAIGAGIADGMGYGANTKAAYLTRGLAEITRLGVAAGASPLTFGGLAGLGDLMATCYSPMSRNYRFGGQIAKGQKVADILSEIGEIVEGINTVPAALEMAKTLQVDMPITDAINRILFDELDLIEAVDQLLSRDPKSE